MTPEAIAQAAGTISKQDDRYLMVFTALCLIASLVWMIRYFMTGMNRLQEKTSAQTDRLIEVVTKNNAVIDRNTEVMTRASNALGMHTEFFERTK